MPLDRKPSSPLPHPFANIPPKGRTRRDAEPLDTETVDHATLEAAGLDPADFDSTDLDIANLDADDLDAGDLDAGDPDAGGPDTGHADGTLETDAPVGTASGRKAPLRIAPNLRDGHIQEAREIAVEAGWPALCADPRCRGRAACVGKLRRIGDSARCYPGCLAFALGTLIDPSSSLEAGSAVRDMFPPEETIGPDEDAPRSVVLVTILLHWSEMIGQGTASRDAKPRPSHVPT